MTDLSPAGANTTRWLAGFLVVALVGTALVGLFALATGDENDTDEAGEFVERQQLRVEMPGRGDTWSARFVDDDTGNTVLATPAEGAIAVTTATGTFVSGEVLDVNETDSDTVAVVATGPDGPNVTVTSSVGDDGHPNVEVDAGPDVETVALDLTARDDERFLGTGARATGVDHRGGEVLNRVLDGPYTDVQNAVVSGLVPPAGFDERPDSTYYPVPWVLSTSGYGLLVEDDEVSTFTFATPDSPDRWSIEIDASRLRTTVFGGPTPADALAAMTESVGRQPEPPAPYVLGPWWQPAGGSDESDEAQLDRLRAAGVPVSVAQTYLHYLPCGDHVDVRDETRAHTAAMHDAGVAVTAYVNPMVCVEFSKVHDAGIASDAFTGHPDGGAYVYPYFTSTSFEVVQFDFTSPDGIALFESVLDLVVEDGYDGWMEDFGEYTPDDATSADGTPGTAMHNRYVDLYHAAAARYAEQAPRPLARYTRSGWRNSAGVSPIVWGGDPTTAWGFDGLESTLWSGLGMGLSGVSTWGSDIGGFFSFSGEELTPELMGRWIELGAFSGVMRLQSNGINVGGGPRAQVTDDDVLAVWKRYSQLRTRLYPYIGATALEYRTTGLPIMRHHALTHPDDAEAYHRDDQFLFGADMLVAPALAPGMTEREVYLPDGSWIDVWRSLTLDDDGSVRLGLASTASGPGIVVVPTPVGSIPLFLRAGAVLPLLPADVTTLADYGEGRPGVVRLADRDDVRELLGFVGPDWSGPLGPGESMHSAVSADGTWTLALEASRPRTYRMQVSYAALDNGIVPCTASVDGTDLEIDDMDFDWNPDTRVLTFDVELEVDSTLTVNAC